MFFYRFNSGKTPVVSIRRNGNVYRGSIATAKNAIDIGADIRVVSRREGDVYSAHFENVEYRIQNETLLSGLSIWHVTQRKKNGDHYVFRQWKTSWEMSMWPTTSEIDKIQWLVGEHFSPSDTVRNQDQSWYADPCWTLAYQHDGNGNPVQGSFQFLKSALENGHRIKAVFAPNGTFDRSIEPDMTIIIGRENGTESINAMNLNNVSKDSLLSINDDTFWFWQIYIRTTGRVTVYTWDVGRNTTPEGNFDFNADVKWFIDTRTYISKYANDDVGNTVSGTKQDLVDSIFAGADIRLKFDLPVSPPVVFETILVTPDQLKITQPNNTLQITSIEVRASDANPSSNPNSSVWWFNMATTTGKLDVSRWTVGAFEDRGHNSFPSNMNWFVSV